jgi:hypothetical protein
MKINSISIFVLLSFINIILTKATAKAKSKTNMINLVNKIFNKLG